MLEIAWRFLKPKVPSVTVMKRQLGELHISKTYLFSEMFSWVTRAWPTRRALLGICLITQQLYEKTSQLQMLSDTAELIQQWLESN
jgi:hypothetical protein